MDCRENCSKRVMLKFIVFQLFASLVASSDIDKTANRHDRKKYKAAHKPAPIKYSIHVRDIA